MVDAVKQPYQGDAYVILDDTELSGLTNNSWSALSAAEFDSATFNQLFRDLEGYLAAQGANRTSGAHLAIYAVPTIDGINYMTWTTGSAEDAGNEQYYVGSISFKDGVLTAERQGTPAFHPPWGGKFKIAVRNKTGQTLTAGSTLKGRRHGYSSQ